jgi:hypothetical protein
VVTLYSWLLLTYTLPTEPSALRVRMWRKLKRAGAILLQDALWILPATPRTREEYQWLAAEISELGGQALYWEAQLVMGMPEEILISKFQGQVEIGYQSLLEQMGSETSDLESIARQYQQLLDRDYFHCESGQRVRQAILDARGENT